MKRASASTRTTRERATAMLFAALPCWLALSAPTAFAQQTAAPSFRDTRPVPLVQRPGDEEAEARRRAEETLARIEADAAQKRRIEEAKARAEEEQRRLQAEADAKRRADDANRLQAATEARRKADEDAKRAPPDSPNKQ